MDSAPVRPATIDRDVDRPPNRRLLASGIMSAMVVIRILGLAALLGSSLWLVAINTWSIQALRLVNRHGFAQVEFPSMPPGHGRGAIWEALTLAARNQTEDAIRAFEDLATSQPNEPLVLVPLGQAHMMQGDVEKAVARWTSVGSNRVIARAADNAAAGQKWSVVLRVVAAANESLQPELVSDRADALRNTAGVSAADDSLRLALGTWPTSDHRPDWLIALGDGESTLRHWPDAIAAYRQASGISSGVRALRANVGLGQAIYASGGGAAAALIAINQGIVAMPALESGYVAAGDILLADGRAAEAMDRFRGALNRDPKNRWIVERLASATLPSQGPASAIQIVDAAIQSNPAEAFYHYLRAELLYHNGDSTGALASVHHATRLAPDQDARYWVLEGQLYAEVSLPAQAATSYEAALQLDPGNEVALKGLAVVQRLTTCSNRNCNTP